MTKPLQPFRSFLADVRVEAADKITSYICRWDKEADPADVHEDVREALAPFFERIREHVEGPTCKFPVPIGKNAAAHCDLLAAHEGDHHPCVGKAMAE